MMKQKQWFTVAITLLAALALSLSVLAMDAGGGVRGGIPRSEDTRNDKDTDMDYPGEGLVTDLQSAIDDLESDLLPDGTNNGTVTGDDATRAPATGTGSVSGTGSGTTDITDGDGGSGIGLVIGICVAVIVLILVFVILSRNGDGKGKK